MNNINEIEELDFSKYEDGLIPVIVQDHITNVVLMLGFMNKDALQTTIDLKLVTFYSRSKQRLWTKGEGSKNYLHLVNILPDCDNDTLLIKASPEGPTCHTGADTCFNEKNIDDDFLKTLEEIIAGRETNRNAESYTSSLFDKGINSIVQKVGEEAVELIIEGKDNNHDRFINEAADLLFHYMVLLRAKGFTLNDVKEVLKERHKLSEP